MSTVDLMSERSAREAAVREFRDREESQLSLLWIVAVLVRERRTILIGAGIGVLIGLAIASLRKPTFTSSFSFVPQAGQDAGRSGLANLAGQFGILLGTGQAQAQSPQFYADLLESRELLAPIAADTFVDGRNEQRRVALTEFLGTAGTDSVAVIHETVRVLRDKVVSSTVATRSTGVVTVNIRTKSPGVSLGIAQQLLMRLNEFNLRTRQSQAAAERRFVEGRLESARAELRQAEDALQRFLQANRQISNSPQLRFEQERRQRDVDLQQQVVMGLAQQYEEARIREVRDTPVITTIERPVIAAKPDARRRVFTLAAGLSVGLLLAMSYVLAQDALRRRATDASDPAVSLLRREWQRFRGARA
jgi:uncharacterized protein involved in exopolysaccharide biosynthesis